MRTALLMATVISSLAFPAGAWAVEDESKPTKVELAGGKLVLMAPKEWKLEKSRSSMIQHEFSAPADAKEGAATARITFSTAGGSISANIDRWKGQFENVDKDKLKVEKFEAGKQTVHLVDIAGDFNESMGGGPFAPGKIVKRADYRMIGAIIETQGLGQHFIKLVGPQDVVKPLADGMKKMLQDLVSK
ncbi:MAG: hypothetical protein KDB22_27700 [Planctomycetales bacterium]|nr:hypothetical protein [Planctomycetales bacterium]